MEILERILPGGGGWGGGLVVGTIIGHVCEGGESQNISQERRSGVEMMKRNFVWRNF